MLFCTSCAPLHVFHLIYTPKRIGNFLCHICYFFLSTKKKQRIMLIIPSLVLIFFCGVFFRLLFYVTYQLPSISIYYPMYVYVFFLQFNLHRCVGLLVCDHYVNLCIYSLNIQHFSLFLVLNNAILFLKHLISLKKKNNGNTTQYNTAQHTKKKLRENIRRKKERKPTYGNSFHSTNKNLLPPFTGKN